MTNPVENPLEIDYVIPDSIFRPGKSEPMPIIALSGDVNGEMVATLRRGLNKLRERDDKPCLSI